jgi:4-alpha-glucanotransferase
MKKRTSGIILHITSLPSSYGIGDFGPSAYHFADFLEEAGQRIWQILPLNPINEGNCFSPYSSLSAFAGNTLLISPDILVWEKLLSREDLQNTYYFRDTSVDYVLASSFKDFLFDQAFKNFKKNRTDLSGEFQNFCQQNAHWLDDYALFIALKVHYKEQSWSQWPVEFRDRHHNSLESARHELNDFIERERFLQFLFFRQWYQLKNYCNQKKINILGDLPFYIGYDSSDVWANPHFFKLTEDKQMIAGSGVPPDYFSATGQLWNTPVFNWEVLRQHNFEWWIERMGHNFRMFDKIRLDHFRAFSAYWEVPAGHDTAINGRWVKSPGYDILRAVNDKYNGLPILAEDLGLIDDEVRELMSTFNLPGMKVLLFSVGPGMAQNPYVPHNHVQDCVVYTGTHDNNTVRGWYDQDSTEDDKKLLMEYLNCTFNAENVHDTFIRMALSSVADTAIFPLQDALGLGASAIMNKPSVAQGNWTWRFIPDDINCELAAKLYNILKLYDR